jgi:predicted DNA-binding protein with PD1-like motif
LGFSTILFEIFREGVYAPGMICKNTLPAMTYAFRLLPGQDLKKELAAVTESQLLKASVVLSSVGSLKIACLRLANGKEARTFEGPFEIVSLTGTLGQEGLHLHISLSDAEGKTLGGHLVDGCIIHTTAEIVLLEQPGLEFARVTDAATGFKELSIRKT